MTWNEFKKFIENNLSEEQKNYAIYYINISATFIQYTEVFIDKENKEITIQ